MQVFQGVTQGLGDGPVSVCNSAATLRYPEIAVAHGAQAHWVRPGICLYGASPFADADAATFGLRPAMRSEEHTSELQSLIRISYAVFCLKKKKKKQTKQ